ncbi:bifunctional N(6)-L-threonylcarbamoyladenine synthase/serine/threonine protein kinase [Candidatus Woesearchaeota archaeon]|nr:bifunctional N(6)-L-threonylcarbamoyladenine synthase/serine/threonine protein kinase [Candidatus Woesearchaeota archaeon]
MYVLGIETTAHTFGVGIIDEEKNILANVKDCFTTESGGMVPFEAQKHHVDICDKVVKEALEKANLTIKDIGLISFSQSPGMAHCLKIGAMMARSLAILNDIPLIGINHCIAHLTIGEQLTDANDCILLYVSGANTQVIAYEGEKYRVFGETLDIGIGNFLDTFARDMGLGFPGGPKVAALAEKGKNYIELPYTVKGMDVQFSGLTTNLKNKLRDGVNKEDLSFSVQETVFAMMVEVAERAIAHTGKKELLLGGGVACNTRLQEMCKKMCDARGVKFYVLENQFNVDNGVMIAFQGLVEYKSGKVTKIEDSAIDSQLRTDDVDVTWK